MGVVPVACANASRCASIADMNLRMNASEYTACGIKMKWMPLLSTVGVLIGARVSILYISLEEL